jgi:oligopeptide transport system substrate-binding protein
MSRRWAGALVASMALAAAGCGSNSGDDAAQTGGTPARGHEGGTFSVGEVEPDHLIPGRSGLAFDQIQALFAPLSKVDEDGKLVNVAAQSITSKDEKVWTIKIKPGWTFHNGEPVTAKSYVDAWDYTAYGPNAWENNGQLAAIKGYSDLNPANGKPTTKRMSGLKVVDDTTFQVTLTAPNSQFPLMLTAGETGLLPMPKVAYKDFKAYDKRPIGNGPYEMDGDWQHNQQVAVKRYAGYKGPKANADAIAFKIYADLKTAYRDVQADNLDIVGIGQDMYAQGKKDFGDRFLDYAAPASDFLFFSPIDPRFKNPEVRKAFSMAIDREAISTALFGGVLPPATSIFSTAFQGAKTGICDYCVFDAAKAKQALAAAGGFKGSLTISYPAGSGYDSTFQAIGNQLRTNLGISDIKYKTMPFAQFLTAMNGHKLDGVYRGHWGSLYPSMQEPLQSLFVKGGGGQLGPAYSSPEVDRLVSEGNAASDPDGANAKYREAEDKIIADTAVAPLFYAKYVYVHSNRVSNVIADINQIELSDVVVGKG